ncbi:PP2C family protein-serine/threonine phosphatase [Roseimaritima ulvae]|uniref:PP2C family protein-serine/threonine phosphatase n=1 Tax=Roseimaritima ulvae TaxID=980254 RepID=UPI00138FFB58|nr:SpoIIE family protein phosphatase [Roseimaritima ulvae]
MKTTTSRPSYLRLHRAQHDSAPGGEVPTDEMAAFWHSFTESTGWRLDRRSRAIGAPKLLPVREVVYDEEGDAAGLPSLTKPAAQHLAASAAKLIVRLRESEQAVRRQEAELVATATPLAPPEGQAEFADRLDEILQQAVEGTSFVAAAFYMLDDDTSSLKMRAQCGLSEQSLAASSRPLRGALADLEAMVSDVVVIEDCAAGDEIYNSPEPLAAGICAVVSDDDVPIGTLWIWNDTPLAIDPSATAVARLTAIALAAEIARERMTRRGGEIREETQTLRAVSHWQQRQQPAATPLAEGWFVDGLTYTSAPLASTWHTWDILPNGTIALAVAQAHSDAADASMIAATARAAFQSHLGYRLSPKQVLQRVSDTLWQTNTGDQLVSLIYANIDPETGEGTLASAGSAQAMILSRYGFRAITKASEPLCSFPDYSPSETIVRLSPGEVLWAASRDMMEANNNTNSTDTWTQQRVSKFVIDRVQDASHEIVPAMCRALVEQAAVADRSAALLYRQ